MQREGCQCRDRNPAASSFDYYEDMGAHLLNTSDGSIKDRCVCHVLTGCRQNPAISTSFCDFYLCTPVLVTIWYRYRYNIYIYICIYIYTYVYMYIHIHIHTCSAVRDTALVMLNPSAHIKEVGSKPFHGSELGSLGSRAAALILCPCHCSMTSHARPLEWPFVAYLSS